MKTPDSSTLNSLLRQSLTAVARTQTAEVETTAHFIAVLNRIARLYRATDSLVTHSVIEPASATVEINGQVFRAPRLIVQCTWRDTAFSSPLTLIYTPTKLNRITLHVVVANVSHQGPDTIQWHAPFGWHIPDHGTDIDSETHAKFLRSSLYAAGLFNSLTMALEPKTT